MNYPSAWASWWSGFLSSSLRTFLTLFQQVLRRHEVRSFAKGPQPSGVIPQIFKFCLSVSLAVSVCLADLALDVSWLQMDQRKPAAKRERSRKRTCTRLLITREAWADRVRKPVGRSPYTVHLTVIPRAHVGYEMIDSQRAPSWL